MVKMGWNRAIWSHFGWCWKKCVASWRCSAHNLPIMQNFSTATLWSWGRGAKRRVFAKFSLFCLFWSLRSTHSIKRHFSFIPSTNNIQRECLQTQNSLGLRRKNPRSPCGEQSSSKRNTSGLRKSTHQRYCENLN